MPEVAPRDPTARATRSSTPTWSRTAASVVDRRCRGAGLLVSAASASWRPSGRTFADVRADRADPRPRRPHRLRRAGAPGRHRQPRARARRGARPQGGAGNPAKLAGRRCASGRSSASSGSALRHGMLRTPGLGEVGTFDAGATLDVPGAPRVIHAPGHTTGSVALHFAGARHPVRGRRAEHLLGDDGWHGPQLSPFNRGPGAGARIACRAWRTLPRPMCCPGHGAAWSGGVAAAVAQARVAEQELQAKAKR